MDNDLNRLRGDLQKLIAINACHGSMTVDAALALIGAFMMQISKSDIKDWKSMISYVSFLNSCLFKGKNKSKITELDFQECTRYIYRNLLDQPISNKKLSLVSLGLKVIADVSDEGFLSFNNQTFNVYASQAIICGKPAKSFHVVFGEEQQIGIEVANNNNVNTPKQEQKTPNSKSSLSAQTNRKTSRRMQDNTENDPFIRLYNELQSKDKDRRTKEAYAWQWLLTNDEYCAIKNCVKNNRIPTNDNMFKATAKLLSLYIGEFYKREYDNSNSPFNQLVESPNNQFDEYVIICNKLGIKSYSRTIYGSQLFTLYVEGGLPVHYIANEINDTGSNTLVKAVAILTNPEDSSNLIKGEQLLKQIPHTIAISQSYAQRHSIYEYISAYRMCEWEVWAKDDSSKEDFKRFIEIINQSNAEKKKFRLVFNLWTEYSKDGMALTDCYLYPKINFLPEQNGERHYAISADRLKSWGVQLRGPSFNLRIGEKCGVIKELFYTRCFKGDYIPSVFEKQYELRTKAIGDVSSSFLSGSEYAISIIDPETQDIKDIENVIQPAFKEGYLRLYTNDNNERHSFWTSEKGRYSFEQAGIIFNKSRYVPYHKNGVKIYDLNEELGWAYFQSSAMFEDLSKHKCVTFYNTKGQIYAIPQKACIHQLATNCTAITMDSVQSDGSVRCVINGNDDTAYLVNTKGIEFNVYSCEKDIELSDKHVHYRQFDDKDWEEYEKGKSLKQGLYVFRLTSRGYSTQVNCYVIAEEAIVELDKNKLIKTTHINQLVSKDGLKANIKSSIKRNFSVQNYDNEKEFNFSIDDIVYFSTYNPCFEAYIELYGDLLPQDSKAIIAYADHYHVTDIEGGRKYTLDKHPNLYERLFNKLTNTAKSVNPADIAGKIGAQISGYNIHAYTDEITKDVPLNDGRFYVLSIDERAKVEKVTVESLDQLELNTDSLLFQSLTNQPTPPDKYYAPLFVSVNGGQLSHKEKLVARQQKIQDFKKKKTFLERIAFKQFEIACEHRLYFAFSDILLSMAWKGARGNTPAKFVTDDNAFKENIFQFLKCYSEYCINNKLNPNIDGLSRLAVEFLFDWKIIRNRINNANDKRLSDIYNRLVNQ